MPLFCFKPCYDIILSTRLVAEVIVMGKEADQASHALDKARKLEEHGMRHPNDKKAHIKAREKDEEYMKKKFGR